MDKYRKYESSFKLRLVKDYQRGKSLSGLSKEWDISTSQIRKWVDQYTLWGIQGIKRSPNQKYTKQFKLRVVQTYLKKELSLRNCCLHFGIPSIGIISSWIKIYESLGEDGLNAQQKGRKTMKEDKPTKAPVKTLTRLEELEKENLYLRAENELLKKLEALAQEKKAQKKKR